MKTYTTILHVRGYELDSFGHVNHAVYISYLEHARWEMLLEAGITLQKMEEWKCWPVIASLEAQYLRPTYLGDTLKISTRAVEKGKLHIVYEHEVQRGEDLVFRGKIKVVIVNEQGRPTPPPQAFNDAF